MKIVHILQYILHRTSAPFVLPSFAPPPDSSSSVAVCSLDLLRRHCAHSQEYFSRFRKGREMLPVGACFCLQLLGVSRSSQVLTSTKEKDKQCLVVCPFRTHGSTRRPLNLPRAGAVGRHMLPPTDNVALKGMELVLLVCVPHVRRNGRPRSTMLPKLVLVFPLGRRSWERQEHDRKRRCR
jgi:hypothetical protein